MGSTQSTPNQSLPKTGHREKPSNKEKPKTAKPSKPSADGEDTDTDTDTDTHRPSSEISMPTKGLPSKLLQHEKRELPSKPGKEVTGKTPSSTTQNTPDQSLPKTGTREQPSNQEKNF